MCEGVKQSLLFICLSVYLCSENFEISTFAAWVKQLLYVTITWQSNVCVPDGRDQSISILHISSTFLFKISTVHHFDAVNKLDMVETSHMRMNYKHAENLSWHLHANRKT